MKSWLTKIDEWANLNRPTALFGVVGLTLASVLFANWVTGEDIFQQIFYPKRETVADVRFWSALIYALAFALGLPVAFLLWHWRDRNVRDQIDNARKDINLKEFQELQLRAAGVLDEKMPSEAREQLQISALHQLRSFLRGEYGPSFNRPALELLLAGHAAAITRIGVLSVQQQIAANSKQLNRYEMDIILVALTSRLSPVDQERMNIIRDEFNAVFNHEFPLKSRRFDLLDLDHKKFPKKLDLSGAHFFGAEFYRADFEEVILKSAHFEGATLVTTNLKAADCRWSHFQNARMPDANLENSNFYDSHLESSIMTGVNLTGAKFHKINYNYWTKFDDAFFDNNTIFGDKGTAVSWRQNTEVEKDEIRSAWVRRGAINIDSAAETDRHG